MKLKLNESIPIEIIAKCKWNPTEIEISAQEEYKFEASGSWSDLMVKTDADGYTNGYMRLFNNLKRAKQYPWFALVGVLNQSNNEYFLIGKNNKIAFEQSGKLYCFANDVNGFYWNNFGSISLKVTRIK